MPSLSRSGPKMFFDEVRREPIVPGGDRRVRGEDGAVGDFAEGFVEREAVVAHPLANHFERRERAVAFVEVIDAGHDVERAERLHAADAEHQLLADAGSHVAAVEPRRQLAVLRAVAVDVAIEQIQRHAADVHQPDLGHQPAVAGFDRNGDLLVVGADRRRHRQVFDSRVEVFFLLEAVAIEMLLEIALVVEQADGHERHGQAAGALDVVAGEHAQAARVDRHRFVQAELGGEIGDRPRAEDAGFAGTPGVARVVQVFLEPAMGLVDARVEHHLGRPLGELLGRHLGEHDDRIVVDLSPLDRIQVAKQVDDFRVPAPPQVRGQCQAFVVERLRSDFGPVLPFDIFARSHR